MVTIHHGAPGRDTHAAGEARETVTTISGSGSGYVARHETGYSSKAQVTVKDTKGKVIFKGTRLEADAFEGKDYRAPAGVSIAPRKSRHITEQKLALAKAGAEVVISESGTGRILYSGSRAGAKRYVEDTKYDVSRAQARQTSIDMARTSPGARIPMSKVASAQNKATKAWEAVQGKTKPKPTPKPVAVAPKAKKTVAPKVKAPPWAKIKPTKVPTEKVFAPKPMPPTTMRERAAAKQAEIEAKKSAKEIKLPGDYTGLTNLKQTIPKTPQAVEKAVYTPTPFKPVEQKIAKQPVEQKIAKQPVAPAAIIPSATKPPIETTSKPDSDSIEKIYDAEKFGEGLTDLKQTLEGVPYIPKKDIIEVPTPLTGVERITPDIYRVTDPVSYTKDSDKAVDTYVFKSAVTDKWTEADTLKHAKEELLGSQQEYLQSHAKDTTFAERATDFGLYGVTNFKLLAETLDIGPDLLKKKLIDKDVELDTEEFLHEYIKHNKKVYEGVDQTAKIDYIESDNVLKGIGVKTLNPFHASDNAYKELERVAYSGMPEDKVGRVVRKVGIGALELAPTLITAAGGGVAFKGGIGAVKYGLSKTGQQLAKKATTSGIGLQVGRVGRVATLSGAHVESVALTSGGVMASREIAPVALGGKAESFGESAATAVKMSIEAPAFIGGYKAVPKLTSVLRSPFGKEIPIKAMTEPRVLSGVGKTFPKLKEGETIPQFKQRFKKVIPELGESHTVKPPKFVKTVAIEKQLGKPTPEFVKHVKIEKAQGFGKPLELTRGTRAMTVSVPMKKGEFTVPPRKLHSSDPPGHHYADTLSPYFLRIPAEARLIDVLTIPKSVLTRFKKVTKKSELSKLEYDSKTHLPKPKDVSIIDKAIDVPFKALEVLYGKPETTAFPKILRTTTHSKIERVPKDILKLELGLRSKAGKEATQKYIGEKAEKGKFVITRDVEANLKAKYLSQFAESEIVLPPGSKMTYTGKPWLTRPYIKYRGQRIPIYEFTLKKSEHARLKTKTLKEGSKIDQLKTMVDKAKTSEMMKLKKKTKPKTKKQVYRPKRRVEKLPLYSYVGKKEIYRELAEISKYKQNLSKRYKPPVKEYVPPTKEYIPQVKEYVPPTKEYVPQVKEYIPPTKEYIPPTKEYIPPVKEYVPPTKKYKPPTKEYIPPVKEYVPPTKEYTPPVFDIPIIRRKTKTKKKQPIIEDLLKIDLKFRKKDHYVGGWEQFIKSTKNRKSKRRKK